MRPKAPWVIKSAEMSQKALIKSEGRVPNGGEVMGLVITFLAELGGHGLWVLSRD
jgi:hypothetical protein